MSWNPSLYERFRRERAAPFYDLLGMIERRSAMRVVDLGCGTGDLTRVLHERLGAVETIGIDSSPEMLAPARELETETLRFRLQRIEDFAAETPLDLVASNAALHWIENHPALFSRLTKMLAPGGQIAVQMPANHAHPTQVVAREVAAREPWVSLLGPPRRSPVLAPADYAVLLRGLGFREQQVELHVYLHDLSRAEDLVEWMRGTALTSYAERLGPERFADYLREYREALFDRLGVGPNDRYALTYERLLLWGLTELIQ